MSEILTTQETVRLAELESIIENNFALMGKALFEIRESRLYKATHGTFEGYCQERFDMSRKYINKQIQAAVVIENLTPMGVIPINERQARPLAKLPAEHQPAAWGRAQEIAKEESKPVAARHVEAAVLEIMPKDEPDPVIVDGTHDDGEPKRRSPIKIIEDEGMNIWLLAKTHLDRINKNDTQRIQALTACAEYCSNRIQNKK
jgi:hypothetical protein